MATSLRAFFDNKNFQIDFTVTNLRVCQICLKLSAWSSSLPRLSVPEAEDVSSRAPGTYVKVVNPETAKPEYRQVTAGFEDIAQACTHERPFKKIKLKTMQSNVAAQAVEDIMSASIEAEVAKIVSHNDPSPFHSVDPDTMREEGAQNFLTSLWSWFVVNCPLILALFMVAFYFLVIVFFLCLEQCIYPELCPG